MSPAGSSPKRKVGRVRPSHIMYSAGVGAIVDLPHFSVLVMGTDQWRPDLLPEGPEEIREKRLLAEASRILGPTIKHLYAAPWLKDDDRIGVPVTPFPQWMRCTACNLLAPAGSGKFDFVNPSRNRPDLAKFQHASCTRRKRPLAVSARFALACPIGHLDDFPYTAFVHRGQPCEKAVAPDLRMEDHGSNIGATITLTCVQCEMKRNLRDATGPRAKLPLCRGRQAHFQATAQFAGPCDRAEEVKLVVVGASNQWFPLNLSVLAVPEAGVSKLEQHLAEIWDTQNLAVVTDMGILGLFWKQAPLKPLHEFGMEATFAAIERRRGAGSNPAEPDPKTDLLTPEWHALTQPPGDPQPDFAVRREPVPSELSPYFSDVAAVDRLRLVRALIGFTRLDAPDPEEPELVRRAPLARYAQNWLPASEVRGEGIFLRVPEDLLTAWEQRLEGGAALKGHLDAYRLFRRKRWSDRVQPSDWHDDDNWPGACYIALHTLSHLLIREIALECGYNSASLAERIYPSDPRTGEARAGILIYTAVPDSEGTLGGLVSLTEKTRFPQLVEAALEQARWCSSDPLCGEREPHEASDHLHAASCHSCLFVSETTCERGNRFLDRRLIVPVGTKADLALWK